MNRNHRFCLLLSVNFCQFIEYELCQGRYKIMFYLDPVIFATHLACSFGCNEKRLSPPSFHRLTFPVSAYSNNSEAKENSFIPDRVSVTV